MTVPVYVEPENDLETEVTEVGPQMRLFLPDARITCTSTGEVYMVRPLSIAAWDWMREKVDPEVWRANPCRVCGAQGYLIEDRFLDGLVEVMRSDGLVVP